jgi:hypothetical protein
MLIGFVNVIVAKFQKLRVWLCAMEVHQGAAVKKAIKYLKKID